MTDLIKIDFTPVSDYMIEMDVDDDLLDQFDFLALKYNCELNDFTEDDFFKRFE